MRRFRARLTYANVVSTLALVIAVGTGSAYAANTVFSEDIVNGQVKVVDLGKDAVRSGKVADNNLTGVDIKDQSGVDTCVSTKRVGQLWYRVENFARLFVEARLHCANLGLRLPTYGEALQLVRNRDVPGINENEFFWTDEFLTNASVWAVADAEGSSQVGTDSANTLETVCVTVPTN